jgi:hypothetical protein
LYFAIRCMCFSISSEESTFNKMNDSPTSDTFQISSIPFTSYSILTRKQCTRHSFF